MVLSGGRGGSRIARELRRQTSGKVTIVVNALDDGKSTGVLRDFIPGMLGPSDVRKNVSELVTMFAPHRLAMRELLEYRLDDSVGAGLPTAISEFSQFGRTSNLPVKLRDLLSAIPPSTRDAIRKQLLEFVRLVERSDQPFQWHDAAFGNLIFAGCHLSCEEDFNQAIGLFASLVEPELELVNATTSGDFFLRGIGSRGSLLMSENEVITPPPGESIDSIYIHSERVAERAADVLRDSTFETKIEWLERNAVIPPPSAEAVLALQDMTALVVAPGTPNSSQFPSMIVLGNLIRSGPDCPRVLIANLDRDDESVGMSLDGYVSLCLSYVGDPRNTHGTFTHVLVDPTSALAVSQSEGLLSKFGIDVRYHNLRAPSAPDRHSAFETSRQVLALCREYSATQPTLRILIDARSRQELISQYVADLGDVRWKDHLSAISVEIVGSRKRLPSPDFVKWSMNGDYDLVGVADVVGDLRNDFFALITGDGYYAVADILRAIELMRESPFGAVIGSRVQNRSQVTSSVSSVYQDRTVLKFMSKFGGAMISALIRVRMGAVVGDPLSGLLVVRTTALPRALSRTRRREARNEVDLLLGLLGTGVEVAEVPVEYAAPQTSESARARVKRGLANLSSGLGL